MSKLNKASELTVLAAALAAAFGTASAQDATVKELTTPDSVMSVGVGAWNKNRMQQGIYDGMSKQGGYWLIDGNVRNRDAATGTWFNLNLRNLGLDTREFSIEVLRQGDVGVTLDYNRTPRMSPYFVTTGLTGFGTVNQNVSTPTVTPGSGTRYELESVRENIGMSFFKRLAPGLDLNVKYSHEDKSGNRMYTRGGQPEFAPELLDSTTQQLDATINYTTERLQLSGGYNGSWYKNGVGLITSRLGANVANWYFLSQPMDNMAHQFFVNGGYNFWPGTRGTFKVAYTRATQDEHLPTSDITTAGATPLAGSPSSLNGRLDTTLIQLGWTSRVNSQLSWLANLRYHNLKDKTPQAQYVLTGAGTCNTTATCVDNTPLSFKTLTGKLEATYRLPEGFALIGGIDLKDQDRTVPVGAGSIDATGRDRQRYVPFRANLDETTYRLQLRRSMSETLNGSLAYMHIKRDGSAYTITEEVESDEITPLHIADRKSDRWRFTLDWAPVEQFSIQFNLEDGKDKYRHDATREFGPHDGSTKIYSIDASFKASENLSLTAWWSHDKSKASQFNGRWTRGTLEHEADTESHLTERGDSFGIGLRAKAMANLRWGADLQWTRNKSEYDLATTLTGLNGPNGYNTVYPASGGVPLLIAPPDITNKLTKISLFAIYALSKNSELRYDLVHEKWRTDDWTWTLSNGAPFTFGTANDGTTVFTQPRSSTTFFGVRYSYKFQ